MATPTYTPIASIVVGTTTNSITFSSIPSGFRDLVIQGGVRSTRAASAEDLFIQLNGDTGSNYTGVFMYGTDSGTTSSFTTNTTQFSIATNTAAATATSGLFTAFYGQIMDYSATDKHKTFLTRNAAPTQVWAGAGRHSSTSAVTSFRLFYNIGNFEVGSKISLYGIEA